MSSGASKQVALFKVIEVRFANSGKMSAVRCCNILALCETDHSLTVCMPGAGNHNMFEDAHRVHGNLDRSSIVARYWEWIKR